MTVDLQEALVVLGSLLAVIIGTATVVTKILGGFRSMVREEVCRSVSPVSDQVDNINRRVEFHLGPNGHESDAPLEDRHQPIRTLMLRTRGDIKHTQNEIKGIHQRLDRGDVRFDALEREILSSR